MSLRDDIRTKVRRNLEQIQKENEASRFERFKQDAKELIEIYKANNGNFSNHKKQTVEEFVSGYIPPKMFKKLVEAGIFDE